MKFKALSVIVCAVSAVSAGAQETAPPPVPSEVTTPAIVTPKQIVLPAETIIQVTSAQDITSIKMKEGDTYMLQVASDVIEDGKVIIRRGTPVKSVVAWRTGKGIGGKSAKFDLAFESVTIDGNQYKLKGKHRQEGKGNTVAALLGSMLVSGRSAVVETGQILSAFTAEPIPAN